MSNPKPVRPHGALVRGIGLSRSSVLFGGPFGRIFRALPPADYGATDQKSEAAIKALAAAMTSVADPEDPKDGVDDEESGIPAAYTYFGQFVDHDLTFDPASSLQKQNDPDALVDYRTPRFDLDNIYGRGPDDQPYFYENGGRTFILGPALTGGGATNSGAHDLQRNQPNDGSDQRAIIGDPRNDENIIVSQLQGLFHRFHNKIAQLNPTWTFPEIQREVRFHYQWVVLNDFLPRIINQEVFDAVVPHVSKKSNIRLHKAHLEYYHPKNEPFMPLEFSVAAYRFGHSMVRPGYQLNPQIGPLAIFEHNPSKALTGFRKVPSDWAIDWNLFIDLEPRPAGNTNKNDPINKQRTQLAYRIDTSLVSPLGKLPPSVAINPSILAERNLLRGWRLRLPSGQDVARAMGVEPLKDSEILIGKFDTSDSSDIKGAIATIYPGDADAFKECCPLWTYILAETIKKEVTFQTADGPKKFHARQLGHVGGRIVTETFVGILLGDSSSYLAQDPLWQPSLAVNGVFGLRELIATALQG